MFQKEENMQTVILIGNRASGFVVVGPFPDFEAAQAYIESDPERENMSVFDLHAPADPDPDAED